MSNKKSIENVTVGADVEVFIGDKAGHIISAEGIIKGSKEEPFRFVEGNNYFGTSLDNVMAEFNIPPATSAEEFSEYINYALSYIQKSISGRGLDVFVLPAARLNETYLQTENAKVFGCDPDFDAWLMGTINPKPTPLEEALNLRSCGGHIHVGYKKPDLLTSMRLVRAMDIFLGMPSVVQEPDNERKSLYGRAGAFRQKNYGVEYRTISNYYANSDALCQWVYNNTMEAVEFARRELPISSEEAEAIKAAINFGNKELAITMCQYFNVKVAA